MIINKDENEENLIKACRCKTKINGRIVDTIIDTGAATCIIAKGLLEILGLKIERPSKVRFRIANGKVVPSIGKVTIEVEMGLEKILIEFEVIDSRKMDLIIGIKFLALQEAIIDFGKRTLKININEREIEIRIIFNEKFVKYEEIIDENDEEYNEEQELYESNSDEEWEEYDNNNPAYYLAELIE